MLKISKNHTIYEVWNESAAESVWIDHYPSAKECDELRKKTQWKPNCTLLIEKMTRLYTRTSTVKKECPICYGIGRCDNSLGNGSYICHKCNGSKWI